ncbi:hypothetical protein OG997_32770 [Streptomyces chartreusis]|nr:hypothetical protein [Streptomyces chartreusis]WUB21204.1 hypothetical protein OG997_32770 [Streptomyces chartreusis]
MESSRACESVRACLVLRQVQASAAQVLGEVGEEVQTLQTFGERPAPGPEDRVTAALVLEILHQHQGRQGEVVHVALEVGFGGVPGEVQFLVGGLEIRVHPVVRQLAHGHGVQEGTQHWVLGVP